MRTGLSLPAQTWCQGLGIPAPEAEYRFSPPRRWRFDYAWPGAKVALEVQGGLFTRGRHTRGPALLKEHEKLNRAALLGWRLVYCTPREHLSGEGFRRVAHVLTMEGRL
jgi:hypothetical protein